jgi:MATE family multidrug resistance protein
MIARFFKNLSVRWSEEDGYRDILSIAFPLILSTGSWSLQHFIDRMFLTWYSGEAIAASMPAGMVNWTIASLFVGTASYVNTFVAQYYGANRFDRIGPSVWQGFYLSIVVALSALIIYPFSDTFFRFVGHAPEVQHLESIYFKILLIGTPLMVISNAATGFFSGRGKTWTIMWVNFVGTGVNIVLDYLLIFGKFGFPEMGIKGAGLATVGFALISTSIFLGLMFRPRYNKKYRTVSGWKFDYNLFGRLMRFGLPTGLQFMLEVIAFAIFILLVGVLGTNELAASNISFNINSLAFLPMYGMAVAVAVIVGQHLGENKPLAAEKSTWAAFHLSLFYFCLLAVGYFFFADLFLLPFGWHADAAEFQMLKKIAKTLLKFVAIYSIFDAFNMVFSAALKGAGDTRFVATASILLSWILMLIPSFISLYIFRAGLNWLWAFVTLYIFGLGLIFYWRFLKGPWKTMRVIEDDDF